MSPKDETKYICIGVLIFEILMVIIYWKVVLL